MKLLKDLLFTKGNVSLDIARLCIVCSVGSYWVAVFLGKVGGDALAIGGGCAALFGGAASWMHFRGKVEQGTGEAD